MNIRRTILEIQIAYWSIRLRRAYMPMHVGGYYNGYNLDLNHSLKKLKKAERAYSALWRSL